MPQTITPAAAGMRVSYVEMTLPQNPERYVPGSKRPALLAYCWVQIEDAAGHRFAISDIRLKQNATGHFLDYPAEVREIKCGECAGRNKPKARFCNWCGKPKTVYLDNPHNDLIRPCNKPTGEMVLSAVLAAYRAKIAEPTPMAV